jgi:hypothetical protein
MCLEGVGMEFFFGMMGMSLGVMGFTLGMSALAKVSNLEKQLKEAGVLDKNK